ncbi:MAG TPA: type II secretion system F family protein [Candidatus Omnitrophica bacterium]|nr:type II secretion system F family protein [Candidatus Omnitrophota bacterium]
MDSDYLYYFLFLALIFASVFLVVKQIISQREEIFLRLPMDDTAVAKDKKKNNAEAPMKKVLKALTPISQKVLPFLKQKRTERALLSAGSVMNVLEFISFKLLSALLGFIAGLIIFSSRPMFIFITVLMGFLYPDMWLRKKISARHKSIIRDLPNVIDLLHLCVNAGLDFMLAVNRVIKDFKPCPLRDELSEVWRESQIGRSRKQALQNLVWRVNLVDITSFVRTLIQTDKMGAPMGEALEIQAEELRMRRFQRGEAMAFKAPVKLLFPLLVFILPVVLVIVGGPVILQFVRGGSMGF